MNLTPDKSFQRIVNHYHHLSFFLGCYLCFQRNRFTTSQILTILRIIKGLQERNLEITLLFVDLSKTFEFIYREKMEQILHAYGLLKEIVTAIMMLYKNTKAMDHSPNESTDFFGNVTGVFQGNTLALYLYCA